MPITMRQEVIVEVPQVNTVEAVRQVADQMCEQVIKEVPKTVMEYVEKVVKVESRMQEKQVEVPMVMEKIVEKPVYIERPVIQEVIVDRPVIQEVIKPYIQEVVVERPVQAVAEVVVVEEEIFWVGNCAAWWLDINGVLLPGIVLGGDGLPVRGRRVDGQVCWWLMSSGQPLPGIELGATGMPVRWKHANGQCHRGKHLDANGLPHMHLRLGLDGLPVSGFVAGAAGKSQRVGYGGGTASAAQFGTTQYGAARPTVGAVPMSVSAMPRR